jgi:hypothetical protein
MELPSKRQQKRDFREWQDELRESEIFDGEVYIAPDASERFRRALKFMFASYKSRRGPAIERLPKDDPGHYRKLDDYLDNDEQSHPL